MGVGSICNPSLLRLPPLGPSPTRNCPKNIPTATCHKLWLVRVTTALCRTKDRIANLNKFQSCPRRILQEIQAQFEIPVGPNPTSGHFTNRHSATHAMPPGLTQSLPKYSECDLECGSGGGKPHHQTGSRHPLVFLKNLDRDCGQAWAADR